MKKIIHILMVLGLVIMPLLASAQAANTTASSLSISAADANGKSSFHQSSSLTVASSGSPTGTQTYQFQSDGIYGCNQTGAAASSVGAFTASGVYVPVADAAVELNTGYLVYLFCSLRPLVSALSQSATAGFVKKIDVAITTGNNGNPQFSVNANNEDYQVASNKFVQAIQQGVLAPLNPALRGMTQQAIVKKFAASTQQSNSALACPYVGDLDALLSGQTFSLAGLHALQNPACTPIGAYQIASDLVNGYVDNAVQDNVSQRTMGNGMYPITTTDAFGNINIVTPGSMVLAQANQAQEAGLLKTINAQDLGQMVNALFAGIGAQSVSSPGGLVGITQPTGTQPSYIDQVVTAASQNVTANAVNTAITVLNGVLATLTGYQNALTTIRDTLLATIQSLQASESQCWNQIIQKVCVAGSLQFAGGTATCLEIQAPITTTTTQPGSGGQGGSTNTTVTTTIQPPPITLKVATSAAFSSAVVQAQIASLAKNTVTNIGQVQTQLKAVNALAASISNSTSKDVQSLALQQLDQLTHSNAFPKTSDMTSAQQLSNNINSSMQSLVNTTVQNWQGMTGTTDAYGTPVGQPWDGTVSATTVGWCNYNSEGTLLAWKTLWSK